MEREASEFVLRAILVGGFGAMSLTVMIWIVAVVWLTREGL